MRLQLPVDSAASSDSSAVADSVQNALSSLSENVAETGLLVSRGEWEIVTDRLVQGATDWAVSFVPKLVGALVVAAVFYVAYRVTFGITRRAMDRSARVRAGMQAIFLRVFRVVGLGFIALLVLSQLGIDVSALIAGLGIAGLAISFAAKDSLANFIAGLSILLDRPFEVGDWVEAEGTYGRVVEITLRSTRIRTLNYEVVVVPNTRMIDRPLVNQSKRGPIRVDVPFGIAYEEAIEDAREAVLDAVGDDDRLADPEPRVVTTGLGDSSVDLELHLWVADPTHAVPARFDYTERVRDALDEADVEIPYPHRQLLLDEAAGLTDGQEIRVVRTGGDGDR